MGGEVRREVHELQLLEPQFRQHRPVFPKGSQGVEVDAVEDGLQGFGRAEFAHHGVGEDELPALAQHPADFGEYLPPPGAVQDGVLRPHHVEAPVRDGEVFEAPVHHVDGQGAAVSGVEVPVVGVLDLAQVEACHVASVCAEQVPRRPAIACADVQHAGARPQPMDHGGYPLHGPLAGFVHRLPVVFVDAEMQVLVAVRRIVDPAHVIAVVVAPDRLHGL